MEKDDDITKLPNQQIKTRHLSLIKLLNCISHPKTIVNRDQNKIFAWITICGWEIQTNFAATNLHGFFKEL